MVAVPGLQPPSGRLGVTFAEIAEHYGRAARYVAENSRWGRHADWPAPVGKRGRSLEFDAAAVERFVSAHHGRELVVFEPDRLYTVAEIAEAAGMAADTIHGYISRGRWPEPDEVSGAKLWRGETVTRRLGERRAYGKADR